MKKLGEVIVRYRIPILILSVLLLIPAALGFIKTRINYDILYYLPSDIETMQGQEIMQDEFGKGAYALFIAKGMDRYHEEETVEKIKEVPGVADVVWHGSLLGGEVPEELLPDDLRGFYSSGDETLMAIFFSGTTSENETMDAVVRIREIAGREAFLSGMTAIVTDTRLLVENEIFIYVAIASVLALIAMVLTLDSFLVPLLFLLSIGMAVVYNMGTNIVKGEISFITMALAAVLQLAVTMDYSIFLYESYKEKKENTRDKYEAMAEAIAATINSVVGSSLTTIAGFVALCFMTFTLGLDLGIVMAKGVALGVICCVTVLPSLLLISDRAIAKTSHRPLDLSLKRVSRFITKHYAVLAAVMALLWVPAIIGYNNMEVYYKLDSSLPEYLPSVQAGRELDENFDVSSVHMVLVSKDLDAKAIRSMSSEIKAQEGVSACIGLGSLLGSLVPEEVIPQTAVGLTKSGDRQLMLVTSRYRTASDEMNSQIDELSRIVKSYDKNGMVIGEAACTKDLISITDKDFKVVNAVSIGLIFLLIMIVLRSVSLPFILVTVIELAIYINLGLCWYTGSVQSFIASIVIGTIQLGATVDYAILMTNRYKQERIAGKDRREASREALTKSVPSILTSALGFFAATIGVAVYSDVDLISSLCMLLARGAVISMLVVVLILPAMYMIFDGVIVRTTMGMGVCHVKTAVRRSSKRKAEV